MIQESKGVCLCYSCYQPGDSHEQQTKKKHIRGHLLHSYSVAVNQVMVVTVNFPRYDFILANRNNCFSSYFIASRKPLSSNHNRKYRLRNI